MFCHRPQKARCVLDRGNHLVVDLTQQPDKALTEQHRVIGHYHPHGPYAATFTELSDSQRPIAL
jgi:hypothetical protein